MKISKQVRRFLDEERYVIVENRPHDVIVNIVVAMRDAVSESDDIAQ